MSDENSGNGVAIVAIIVVALLAVGGVYMFTSTDNSDGATTIIERPVPAKKDDPDFSLDIQDEEGDGVKIEGNE